jgi:hypothetical protein
MDSKTFHTEEEYVRMEIRRFVNEGLKDVYENNLLDFDDFFHELEERYKKNE